MASRGAARGARAPRRVRDRGFLLLGRRGSRRRRQVATGHGAARSDRRRGHRHRYRPCDSGDGHHPLWRLRTVGPGHRPRGKNGAGPDRLQLLTSLSAALIGDDPRTVVVVDDAHLLDDGSAALVLHLATSTMAAVIATVRSGEPCPDAVVRCGRRRWPTASISRPSPRPRLRHFWRMRWATSSLRLSGGCGR